MKFNVDWTHFVLVNLFMKCKQVCHLFIFLAFIRWRHQFAKRKIACGQILLNNSLLTFNTVKSGNKDLWKQRQLNDEDLWRTYEYKIQFWLVEIELLQWNLKTKKLKWHEKEDHPFLVPRLVFLPRFHCMRKLCPLCWLIS